MRLLLPLAAACALSLLLGACQNPQPKHRDDFGEKTHRTYNPETGGFEQSPPWGKQGNKPVEE